MNINIIHNKKAYIRCTQLESNLNKVYIESRNSKQTTKSILRR